MKNWTKICDYIRKTSKDCRQYYENLESIDISKKEIILNPKMAVYFAIHSEKQSSKIVISAPECENSKINIKDQNILICPGHPCHGKYKNAKEFLENLFEYSHTYNFPCGILHYKILKNVCENKNLN